MQHSNLHNGCSEGNEQRANGLVQSVRLQARERSWTRWSGWHNHSVVDKGARDQAPKPEYLGIVYQEKVVSKSGSGA